jgi:hypothetical protein
MTPELRTESSSSPQQILLHFLNDDLDMAFTFARMAKAAGQRHSRPYKQYALWAFESIKRSKDRIESRIERLRIEQQVFALEQIISAM